MRAFSIYSLVHFYERARADVLTIGEVKRLKRAASRIDRLRAEMSALRFAQHFDEAVQEWSDAHRLLPDIVPAVPGYASTFVDDGIMQREYEQRSLQLDKWKRVGDRVRGRLVRFRHSVPRIPLECGWVQPTRNGFLICMKDSNNLIADVTQLLSPISGLVKYRLVRELGRNRARFVWE